MGKVRFVGDASNKLFSVSEPSTGQVAVKNDTDGVTLLTADPTTITDAGGVKLSAHGSRHNRAQADALDYSLIAKLLIKSASPTLGTGGSLGSAVTVSPDANYVRVIPLGVTIVVGGTVASGETITVQVKLNFDDGTSNYVDKSYTATGTYYLSEDDLRSLWKNAVGISSISVAAGSSASSTSATVTVYVRGIQH